MILAALLALALQDPPQPPKSGKFRGEIVDPASKEVVMKVRMQIPEPPPAGKKWGFIFVCHGFKGSEGNSYLDGTVGMFQTGRRLANRSSALRSPTLTLVNPPPIGVVTGPFRATLLRRIESRSAEGSVEP